MEAPCAAPLDLALDGPPNAAAFIVTIYGDVVDPRGGVLWMGNLIEICSWVGISETLTRTAVSRLVSAGQLTGERVGRRSFYRLTDAARAEYRDAANILFKPHVPVPGFVIAMQVPADAEQAYRRHGFVPAANGVWVGPKAAVPDLPGVLFEASAETQGKTLSAWAAGIWGLEAFAQQYAAFAGRFAAVEATLAAGGPLAQGEALALRLVMVHAFRTIILNMPALPDGVLPQDWPGGQARAVFNRVYLKISEAAEAHVAGHLVNAEGHLMAETRASRDRLTGLKSF